VEVLRHHQYILQLLVSAKNRPLVLLLDMIGFDYIVQTQSFTHETSSYCD